MANKAIITLAAIIMVSCSKVESTEIASCNDLVRLMNNREMAQETESWLSYIYHHPELWKDDGDGDIRGMGAFNLSKAAFAVRGDFSLPLDAEIRASIGKAGSVTHVTIAFKQGIGVVYSENLTFLHMLTPIQGSNKMGITCPRA